MTHEFKTPITAGKIAVESITIQVNNIEEQLQILIIDKGIGIDKKYQKKVLYFSGFMMN